MMNTQEQIKALEKNIAEERSRLSTDRMDISFGEIINMYQNDELIIKPEYQRLFRWSDMQKTSLIESILLGIPIPPIFVAEDDSGVWELVDGLQRVSTIISFFGRLKEDLTRTDVDSINLDETEEEHTISINGWALESGDLISELEGFDCDTLPKKYLINIKRAVCRVEILRGESNVAMKYELFKRLNSGGSKLTPQEIRNAIYRGVDTRLNTLTEELSKEEDFKYLVDLTEQKKQEQYDQELILRFIAFLGDVDSINSNTEKYLDTFMEKAVNNTDFDEVYYRDLFVKVLGLIKANCEKDVFRSDRNMFVPAYYEGITLGIAHNIDRYAQNPVLLQTKVDELKQDEEFRKYSGSASNSKNRIKNRLRRAIEIFRE